MATRLELHSLLCKILNCPEMGNECRAYFQPPESIRIRYPAIVYGLSNMSSLHAVVRYCCIRSQQKGGCKHNCWH